MRKRRDYLELLEISETILNKTIDLIMTSNAYKRWLKNRNKRGKKSKKGVNL